MDGFVKCGISDNLLSLLLMFSLSMNMNRGALRLFGSVYTYVTRVIEC
jgi:hypothetical protein